ncbi:phospholipase D-like domain-containing protein [Jannaschia rubra]|uniref:Phospholipase D n=2 Tax=Jannaschia rubra TaxID=282197 RepID=A0A0M6XMY3_9RHOB|nr:phospholipase D-like domain-containing protein [Jannaschia rubra]CTQ32439.1 putative cardiolipin synthase YwiE [Jannaschia rubra]SFF82205.1 Phosphatidylserine/phosphatidylglycerophosphate/cardiolipin synthase [Jannaschia rubra]
MPTTDEMTKPLLRPGETCWRIERADRLALIVDAADYFLHLRTALIGAEQAIYLIGWDFDLRIEMVPGQGDADGNAPDGWPNRLGDFLEAVVDRRPDVQLHILKWDGAMLAEIATQAWETLSLKMASKRIHFALDSHHPAGACHHQKIVVVDDRLAFCGGIDVTTERWDTRDHAPDDDRRTNPNGSSHGPWHDVTTALLGPVARALGDLGRLRWEAATGETLPVPQAQGSLPWPDDLIPDFEDVEVGIARTAPRYHGEPLINEIEELYLASIRAARHTIYVESQYLAAGSLCEAMEARLAEPDGPEIVIVNPLEAESFLEDEAMHSIRSRMMQRLHDADARGGGGRFAIFYPVNDAGTSIYVHAKVFIVDDRILRVGSSNVDNRSMGFDTECDIAIDAKTTADRDRIRTIMLSLLAEHLDCDPDTLRATWSEHSALVPAIEELRQEDGRSLRPLTPHKLDPLEQTLANTRLFDPRHWPRSQVSPKDRAKHAGKRAAEPYHLEVSGAGTILLAVGAIAVGIWIGRRMIRRRPPLAAPAISTDRTFRPPARHN